MSLEKKIAYFSMEMGLKREIPTYSGGLGILAGDSIKAAADLGIPIIAVTLMYRKGNFKQKLENDGWQNERQVIWYPEQHMEKLGNEIEIQIYGQPIKLNAWQHNVVGEKSTVPIYFLDADNSGNPQHIKEATNHVYGGDDSNRIYQEAILGIGGIKLLNELKIDVLKYHLNEGHSAFLVFELMKEGRSLDEIKDKCVFTTHTPVEAGLGKFDYCLVDNILRNFLPQNTRELAGCDKLDMTLLALNCSGYVNAVSKRHAETAGKMFGKNIDYITNGVHSKSWTSYSFQELYDKDCNGWRKDATKLKNAKNIPLDKIWQAHMIEKRRMIDFVNLSTGVDMNPEILTIGFARRVAKYKRMDLIFSNINELIRIGSGKLQLIFAGKTHPNDEPAKKFLQSFFYSAQKLSSEVKCVYLEDYNMDLGKLLTSGCDVWLNTPLTPLEASGTSGMKAAHNGVPQLSTLDGWWAEGWHEDVTGWCIGKNNNSNPSIGTDSDESQKIKQDDAKSLYEKLENVILPEYSANGKKRFKEIMRNAIAINASHFNTHRMMKESCKKAYKIEI